MYSLDINFLKDPNRKPEEAATPTKTRKAAQPIGNMIPMVAGGIIAIALIGLPFLGIFWIDGKKTEATEEIAKLEAEIKKAEEEGAEITRLQGEFNQIKQQADAFVDIFNKIQPISAIVQDLLDNVPAGVQIDSITQNELEETVQPTAPPATPPAGTPPAGTPPATPPATPQTNITQKLMIDGIASSYDQANDFLLTLKKSDFFVKDKIYLTSVSLTENPSAGAIEDIPENLIVEFPQVVKYSIEATIKVRPASEILDDLNNKGALGLVSRIKILQEKGVIAE